VAARKQSRKDYSAFPGVAANLSAASLAKAVKEVDVVHRRSRSEVLTTAIAKGVEALDVEQFVEELVHTK
jgi:hypothetical protein